ncbi:DNA polymerase I [Serpentinimonas barnesii]|uniref:DNA polymerase I n=1 Tax=Serpentinimonas barnesii TaxID=1458427 RepID=UPI0009E21916|nr:DNA polymerase I [Serpentinimonas barnesii]
MIPQAPPPSAAPAEAPTAAAQTAAQQPPNAAPPTPAPTLLLVDGSSYLYRAYHAMPDLRAVPGDPTSPATGALRGLINMAQALLREHPAQSAAFVFDAPGPTFRDALYPAYKAQRSPMPDDLRAQIEPIHAVLRLLGWPVLCVPGVEADDVLGTLAQQAAAAGMQVIISSGDKDLSQLVQPRITVIDTLNGKRRDVAGVQAEFGVTPQQMVDYQCLVGDAVDNVPGVEKVGPKTAAKWLQQYGSLDAIVAQAEHMPGAVGAKLRQALDWLPTARQLLSIKTDCDLSAHLDPAAPLQQALHLQAPDQAALRDFYQRYGFKTLARALEAVPLSAAQSGAMGLAEPGAAAAAADGSAEAELAGQRATAGVEGTDAAPAAATPPSQYETVLTWAALHAWLERLQAAPLAALDSETTGLDPMRAEIVGLSWSLEPGQAAYLPLAHDYPGAPEQLPRQQALECLRPWLENAAAPKLGQHIKYERHVFANHGIELRGLEHDTLLQSYVLEAHLPHSLESLAERHLGRRGTSYAELCGKGAQQIPFAQVDIERASSYACEDSDFTLQVHQRLWPRLQADEKLRAVYALEIDCSEVLYRIERHGVLIDAATLARQSHELGQRIVALQEQAHASAGQPFNLSSPKQLGEILYDRLGLPVLKKTATGARSTDEEVLEQLALDYPLPAQILQHRSLSKLKNTYTDKLAALAHPRSGRVHTHYAQAVAVTGRLSSNEPNLQNIPIRTPEGRRVREAFVAAPGHLIASADYSQIELRIMAHLSDDPALLRAFHTGQDVHRATAAEVFGLAPEQVSSEQRRAAKAINFGLIYGMGSFGLAKALGIDNTAARNYIERYFERFAGVRRYMDATRAQAKACGYVETVLGRRLYLPEINSPNGPRRAGAERAAINAPMQGTAADLIKLSMVAVQQALDAQGRASRMIMQVHDELVFELPEAEQDWLRSEVPRLMASVAQLKVPLLAEVGLGANWEQAH